MALSVIVGTAPPDVAAVGLSPLAELTAQLHALTESEHHPQALPDEAMSGHPELLNAAYRWAPLWAAYRARFLGPFGRTLDRSLADELADVAALPMPLFAECAGRAIRGSIDGPPLDRLLDHPGQQERLRQAARGRSTGRTELADRLVGSPEAFRTALLTFLEQYAATRFAADWRVLRPRLQAEATRLRFRVRDQGLAAALAELSPSAALLDEPARVVFDKLKDGVVHLDQRPVLVVPSYYSWPHLIVKREAGWPVIIQYGIRPGGGHGEVSLALLRSRLLVLADPARMRLCRLIAREPLTTSELARRSGMSEPQVSRHLRHLREVELVSSERTGRLVHYQLDLAAIRALGFDLELAIFR